MYVFSMSKQEIFGQNWSFIQSKSAFASLTVLELPLLFNLAQRKPFFCNIDMYGHNNQTISNTHLKSYYKPSSVIVQL